MPKCTIPLWLVFSLQSLVVAGAFIAVILVLVLQQQDQYKASVFREIQLQQEVSNNALTSPIITRERILSQLARRLELDPSIHFQVNNTMQSVSVQRFVNLSYFMMFEDPIAYTIYQYRHDPSQTDANATGIFSRFYGAAGITSDLIVGVSTFNDTVIIAPNPSFPLQFGYTFETPFPVRGTESVTRSIAQWGGATAFANSITSSTKFVSSLTYPIVYNTTLGLSELALSYSINVQYLVALAQQSLLTTDSQALLLERQTDMILSNINVGSTLYDESTTLAWSTTSFPNQAVISRFKSADSKCSIANNCSHFAEEDGNSIISLQHMTTDYSYKMSLFQITPRDFYFAAGERSAMIGFVIGVVAAVVVLVSCVVIWFAVRGPVRRLRESMELAAVMRNDEVEDTSSILTELDLLGQSFTQMNGKLLQARAFMPQSMLCGTDDGDAVEDEGSVADDSFQSSQVFDKRSSSLVLVMDDNLGGRSSSITSVGTNNTGTMQLSTMRSIPSIDDTQSVSSLSKNNTNKRPKAPTRGIEGAGLVAKKVGVLMINARGLHGLATSAGAAKLEREQVRLVELVERCARAEKGVVDAFQGDHFVVTFNAVRAVGTPGRNGAFVGLSVEEGAQRDGLALGRFSMGLSVGRAFVGNVGSATMKKNCTMGNVYTNAIGLERLAKRVGRTCVVNGHCLNDLEHVVYYMLLGSVQLSSDTRDVAGSVMSRVEGAVGDQEWLYQVEGKADPYREYNELVDTYLKQGVEAAAASVTALGARVDDPDGGFMPGAIPHLLALLDRRRQIEAMRAEDLGVLHVGGRHPFDADFDMRSA